MGNARTPRRLATWAGVLAGVSFALSALSALFLAGHQVVAARNWMLECARLDPDPLPPDLAPESLTSSWEWWPMGVRCTYQSFDGGSVTFGPDPAYSVLLVICAAAALAGIVALVIRTVRPNR